MNAKDLDHAVRQAERALDQLRSRALAVIERDERGGSNERDGFPAGSMGGGAPASVLHCFDHGKDNCPCGKNEPVDVATDSTGNAATVEKPPVDEVRKVVRAIELHLDAAVKHLHDAVSQVALGEHLANPDRRTSAPEHCQACGRLVYCTTADPLRQGFCDACRKAWGRWKEAEEAAGRLPDRAVFAHQRRKDAAA